MSLEHLSYVPCTLYSFGHLSYVHLHYVSCTVCSFERLSYVPCTACSLEHLSYVPYTVYALEHLSYIPCTVWSMSTLLTDIWILPYVFHDVNRSLYLCILLANSRFTHLYKIIQQRNSWRRAYKIISISTLNGPYMSVVNLLPVSRHYVENDLTLMCSMENVHMSRKTTVCMNNCV